MVRMEEHTDPQTGRVDWKAYDAARKAAGETCRVCGTLIGFPELDRWQGGERECLGCRDLAKDTGRVCHGHRVRCPHCRHVTEAADLELGLYEGPTDVECPHCGEDFRVDIILTVTYQSPPVAEASGAAAATATPAGGG